MPKPIIAWRSYPLLDALEQPELERMLAQGQLRVLSFRQGTQLHGQGDACQGMELVLSGEVSVHSISPGGDSFTVWDFGPRQLLGGNLVFSANPVYPMTVTAKQPGQLLFISRDTLFSLCCRHPAFLRAFLTHVSDHAANLSARISTQGHLTLRDRIVRYLRAEQQRQGGSSILLPLSKTELAARLRVQRTSLSRELAKMRAQGMIALKNRHIQLLSLPEDSWG